MRIAQVSPLHESVPPRLYGGTERVVSYLTQELVRQGHDVTLFASGDSHTNARFVSCWPEALRLSDDCVDPNVPHLLMLEEVFARADEFDLIHFHTEFLHFPFVRRHGVATITTCHSRQDIACYAPLYRAYAELPLVSVSDSQRHPVIWANWRGTVHHGVPKDLYKPKTTPGDYLLFSGRIAPEKRPDLAIEIARRAGIDLIIAAKVSKVDQPYFNEVIGPLLRERSDSRVEFIGEVNEPQKQRLFAGALALLFPIDWPEPFGLVMIEAMACGTPTIAFRCGSVPEVIDEGVTGFIVRSVNEAVDAVQRAATIDRAAVRQRFDQRFTAERMADDYVAIYRRLVRHANTYQSSQADGLRSTADFGAAHGDS